MTPFTDDGGSGGGTTPGAGIIVSQWFKTLAAEQLTVQIIRNAGVISAFGYEISYDDGLVPVVTDPTDDDGALDLIPPSAPIASGVLKSVAAFVPKNGLIGFKVPYIRLTVLVAGASDISFKGFASCREVARPTTFQ